MDARGALTAQPGCAKPLARPRPDAPRHDRAPGYGNRPALRHSQGAKRKSGCAYARAGWGVSKAAHLALDERAGRRAADRPAGAGGAA